VSKNFVEKFSIKTT